MAEESFKLWPTPAEGMPYGPTGKQKLLFIDELPDEDTLWWDGVNIRRPHYHPTDVVLFVGGARSGKTLSSMRRVISYLNRFPGAVAIIGADNYKQLQRTAMVEWQEVFSHKSPWDHINFKNGIITRKPTYSDQRVVYRNSSVAHFLHFKQEEKLKGLKASIIGFEEADMLPHEGAFEELLARLSNPIGAVRQLILTTNPVKARKGWIKHKFKLWQNDPDYKGKIEPIVPPCKCQFCPKCIAKDRGEWLYVDPVTREPSFARGSECSNPDCPIWEMTSKSGQPFRFKKDNDCPGEQVYFRVIETSSDDNPHKPSDYESSASAGMSKKTAAAMIGGKITEDHEGEVYQALHKGNIVFNEVELDYSKDLIWSLDFNYDPQCSIVAQETETESSFTVNVIDEINLWDALPEHAAKEFCARYHGFKTSGKVVKIYSDPAGLWGGGNDLKPTFYKTIFDYLASPTNELGEIDEENGTPFKVKKMMKVDPKPYRDPTRVKVKVKVSDKVDSLNAMMMNERGETRLFINYSCQYLISSLEGTKWDGTGQNIDKNIDKVAARKREAIMPMTHPSDALGYYIATRFPLIRNKRGLSIVHTPGESSFVVTPGGHRNIPVRNKVKAEPSAELLAAKEEKRKNKEARREAKRQKRLMMESERRMINARKLFGGSQPFFGR